MAQVRVSRIRQGSPAIRLFMSDGSERSTYMPQARAIELLGAPHSGVNLMSCYYPKQTFWPERRLFSDEVTHYRHSICDSTERTPLKDLNDWTDGYYSFDIEDAENDVVRQLADVRRYGQEPRLTVTADIDTPDEDLERIGGILKDFGRMQLRLNHEANGCTWFRFARNVGGLQGEEARRLYYEISRFFIRAHDAITGIAPNVTFVACYNGPGERAKRGELGDGELPHMGEDQLGRMYLLPDVMISLDQYGSLHYGWPAHRIENPPIIGQVEAARHRAFALTPRELCEDVIALFWRTVCDMRRGPVRIDLGELNYDADIHGDDIQAYVVHEAYSWLRRHPEIIGSVTFYELTDMGGLGLFRQREYGDVENVTTTLLLDVYKDIMGWDEFRHACTVVDEVGEGARGVDLVWRSPEDAEGMELRAEGAPLKGVDFKERYWRQVVIAAESGRDSCLYTDARTVRLPGAAQSVKVFALPPDGKDNSPDGFRAAVPVPAPQA